MTIPRDQPRARRVILPAPAAGAQFTVTPTDSGLWLIRSLTATLATSAVVAARMVSLVADDQTDVYARFMAGATQAASLTVTYGAHQGSIPSALVGTFAQIAFPSDGFILRQGHRLLSSVDNVDVGDQWSTVVLDVVSYPTRPPEHLTPAVDYMIESEGM